MENEKKKSIILMLVAVITLLALIIGATYAYFQASGNSGSGTDVNVLTATSDLLTFKIDKDINIIVSQSDFKKGSGNKSDSTKASAILTASNSKNIESSSDRYNIYFIIEANDFIYTTDNATAEILLNVTDPNGNKVENITGLVHTDKGFDITTRTGGFLLVPDYDITATRGNTTTQDWKVEVTLVNLDTDQTKNTGKTLSGKLYVTKEKMSSYELTKITNVETETTYNSIKTTLQVANGTSPIEKYYYGIEKISSDATGYANTNSLKRLAFSDVSLIESDKSTYTFKNLEDNATYKIYSYGIDKNKIKTNMYETEVTTNSYNVAKINSVSHTSTLNSITLNVNAQKGDNEIEKYFYSKDNGETYIESTSSTYTFNNLTDTTEYKIKVKVLDSYGRYSTEYAEAIATVTYILPSVTKVTPTTKYNQITVVTTGTKGTNEISKYYYSINNSSYVEGTSTYTFTNLNEQTTYTIKVKVADTDGRMSNEYSLSATTDTYKLPTITDVTTSSTYNSITINVSGKAGDGAITEYYYSKDDGSNYVKSTSSSYTFTNLTSDTTFYIKVYVKDSNGRSSTTSSKTLATAIYILPSITNVTTSSTSDTITINVSAQNGTGAITEYYYSKDNGANYVQSTSSNYTFTNLTSNTTYYIKVYAKDNNGRISSVFTTNLATKSSLLTDYVISQYTGTQGGNGIYYHNSTLANGAGDNSYRYAGANPNNYVCFGTTTSPCPTDNLYRIIGVIDGKVKLIKFDFATSALLGTDGSYYGSEYPNASYYKGSLSIINTYYWDYKLTTKATNTWSTSSLNTTNLNTNYINNIGSTWANKIAITTWKVGGNYFERINNMVSSGAYANEITNQNALNSTDNATTYSAKIGLMYVSDYGFAVEPSAWTLTMSSYNNTISTNWMHMGYQEWTITRYSDGSNGVFVVGTTGETSGYNIVSYYPGVRPVFFLESSVTYSSGTGTSSDPIRINL